MRRFQVETIGALGAVVELDEESTHHLLHVCRHARGAALVVFDGRGSEAAATLWGTRAGRAQLEITSAARLARPAHPLHLILGVPKGPALDRALRMAVECGATTIHPVLAARSVGRSDRADRWRRITRSAAQQCGRADDVVLAALADLPVAMALVPASLDRRVALPGAPPAEASPAGTAGAAVAIGPEGGWTPQEVQSFLNAGWDPLGLGPWTLRSDTAVAVGLSHVRRTRTISAP